VRIVRSIADGAAAAQSPNVVSLHSHEAIDIPKNLGQAAAIHQDRLRDRPEDAGAT